MKGRVQTLENTRVTMPAALAYFLHAYILLPVTWKFLYLKQHDICPLLKCWKPLGKCLLDAKCRAWINDVAQCKKPGSGARKLSREYYRHVQHPEDPSYCQYQSFDRLETQTALEFLKCIGQSGCIAPAEFSDTCADMTNIATLSLNKIPPDVLQGTWNKVYTTGWDLWPCQWTNFWPPFTHPNVHPPDAWMTEWPHNPNVWRMDLYWHNGPDSSVVFHMDNEMHVGETWKFDETTARATLKTRAVMWGTEAQENWYLLDFHEEWNTMLVYYCAYTAAVNRFDSMSMDLQRRYRG